MSIVLRDVVLPLAEFDLHVSVEMTAASTAVVGPSGAGKTSLIEVIAGLRVPSSGSVTLNGRVVFESAAGESARHHTNPALRRVGYVPQDDALFPHLSVRGNILYGARDGGRMELDRVARVLEIETLLARGIEQLSGGERKRVALARALMTHPEILLLDEPLTGVDPALRKRVLDYLLRVRDEFPIPIIYVTHQQEEAAVLCSEVIAIDRGRIVQAA